MGPTVTVSNRAILTFGNAAGSKAAFSVPRARLGKTPQEAQASMQAIIDSGALELPGIGGAVSARGVKIASTTRTRIV